MDSPTKDQMQVIYQVAASFWQQPVDQVFNQMKSIEILKFTAGKVAGILPAYKNFPSVFFKVYFYDRGFRFETAGLQAAAAIPPVESVRVPSVIAIIPEYKAILMEKRTWEDTSSPWKRLWVNRLGIDWFNVGAWLRTFHDSQTTYQKNEYFLRKKFEKFESHLNALKHLFTRDEVGKMNLIYQSARDYFDQNDCEWVISHGDFGLDNIQKSGSTLEIIDFEDCQLAPREFDVLNCLNRLSYLERFPHKTSTYVHTSQQFLGGYGKLNHITPIHRFLDLLIKLDMLETYHRRRNSQQANWLRRFVYAHFERNSQKTIVISLMVNLN